jgi:hypothetical protein
VSGHIYQLAYEGDLPLDDNQTQPVMSLQSYKRTSVLKNTIQHREAAKFIWSVAGRGY